MFNTNKTRIDLSGSYLRNYCLTEWPTWLHGMEKAPYTFQIYNGFDFRDCYSLKECVLPMSNNINYTVAANVSGSFSASRFVFHTQEDGTPYTANWNNSLTWNLSESFGTINGINDLSAHTYFAYYVKVDGQEVSFDNYNDLIVYCKGLPEATGGRREFGFKYYGGSDGTAVYVQRFDYMSTEALCF